MRTSIVRPTKRAKINKKRLLSFPKANLLGDRAVGFYFCVNKVSFVEKLTLLSEEHVVVHYKCLSNRNNTCQYD